jgi:hypothetical protein
VELLDFLSYRAAFAGVPYGELQRAVAETRSGGDWEASFRAAACRLHRLALERQATGSVRSAREAWLALAGTYQVASLGLHLMPENRPWALRLRRLRRLATVAYRRALSLDPDLGEVVAVPVDGGGHLRGYLRRVSPASGSEPAGTAVLVNGLDSLCEVELHRFAEAFHSRGFHTLTLALPDRLVEHGGAVGVEAETASAAIGRWLDGQRLQGELRVAFGVSYGGQVVARLLAGSDAFDAGVAVSPPAWLDDEVVALSRFRRMLAYTFGVDDGAPMEALASRLTLETLAPPNGRLLVLQMSDDRLFDARHGEVFARWGGSAVEIRELAGEHVGTSVVHRWLPEVCDWCAERRVVPVRRSA